MLIWYGNPGTLTGLNSPLLESGQQDTIHSVIILLWDQSPIAGALPSH
jgi:hypothetical protein